MEIARLKEIYIPVDQISTLPFKNLCNKLIKVNNKEEAISILVELNAHKCTTSWINGQYLLDFTASQIFIREDKEYFPRYLIIFSSNGSVSLYHQWFINNINYIITITKETMKDRIKKLII